MNIQLRLPNKLGDTVLAEPIVRSLISSGYGVALDTPYKDLFSKQEWILSESGKPLDLRSGWADGNRVTQYKERIEAYGIPVNLITTRPRIDNIKAAHELACNRTLRSAKFPTNDKPRIGFAHSAGESFKVWPKFGLLCRGLADEVDVHAFDLHQRLDNATNHLGLPINSLLPMVKAMDAFIANDTGLAHLALALGVPTLVIGGATDVRDLYSPYLDLVRYIIAPNPDLRSLSVVQVLRRCREIIGASVRELPTHRENHVPRPMLIVPKRKAIAAMRLDGLGGTITLLNVASKIKAKTGRSVELITRGYKELLEGHHAVSRVREVGSVDWKDAMVLSGEYESFANVKIGTAKWYGKRIGKRVKDPTLDMMYENHPYGLVSMESYKLNESQLACKALGLDYDTIDMDLDCVEDADMDLPDNYIVFAPGTDPWHGRQKQTKAWGGWDTLSRVIDETIVQVGTSVDLPITGAIDFRGKTNLVELVTLLRRASAIVCNEGGIMHMAYSIKHPKAIVLRGPTRGHLFHYPTLHYCDSHICSPCYMKTDDWFINCPERINVVCMDGIQPETVATKLYELLGTLAYGFPLLVDGRPQSTRQIANALGVYGS